MSQDTSRKVKHLVLDTCAVIKPLEIHNIAEHFYAPPEVFREIKDHRSRVKIETYPFEIKWRDPTTEAMRAITAVAKEVGEYKSLSIVDMKVLALTYDLQQQYGKNGTGADANPNMTIQEVENAIKDLQIVDKEKEEATTTTDTTSTESAKSEEEEPSTDNGNSQCEGDTCDQDEEESSEEDEDDKGWIKPDNLSDMLKKSGAIEIDESLHVGCITMDFAMQNILFHMHLNLVSLSGYRITRIRSYVLRCRACFEVTSNMDKEFCFKCGNKSLVKCAVSLNENGEQVLHVNYRRLSNLRGLKYTLPAPKGGKHAIQEKLFEDQHMPRVFLARVREDPLADGPFSMHDVTSRSAMLGLHVLTKNRRPRNPNEGRPKTGNKKTQKRK